MPSAGLQAEAGVLTAMAVVRGIITEIGGATSHAAVVSRELGVPCIVGCGIGALTALEGRTVTLDATTGQILDGVVLAGQESSRKA